MLPPQALGCPKCGVAAQAPTGIITCQGCGLPFALHAGARADERVVPPPFNPQAERVKVVTNGLVLRKMGLIAPEGVSEGTLDPVTGYIPMDQHGVYFGDIFTVAVWRKVDVLRLIAAAILPLPLGLLFVSLGISQSPVFLAFGLPFVLGTAWMIYRAFKIKVHMARIVGGARTIEVRFDAPIWRRKKFHDELLRRAGIAPSPIP
jgi:hypothetical protein